MKEFVFQTIFVATIGVIVEGVAKALWRSIRSAAKRRHKHVPCNRRKSGLTVTMDETALRKFVDQQIESYHSPQGSSATDEQSAADHVRRALAESGIDASVPRDLFEKVLADCLAKHDES